MGWPNLGEKFQNGLGSVPRGVWALGFVSMFMDVSSEMVHSLLPIFLVTVLGASPTLLGLIEGISEATASIVKLFSGWLSDRLGKRKLLAVIGYGLAAVTKPVFPLATTPFEVLSARFVDRVGKGIRGAPRDALVADITPIGLRGAAFGLRQALDTIGAFMGPLIAIVLMYVLAGDIRAVFGWAVFPAAIAVALIIFGVEEPAVVGGHEQRVPINLSALRGMGNSFWAMILIAAVFTLARFSEAFLILRAQNVGLPTALIPAVLIVMNVVYAVVAAPAGSLADNIDRRLLLGSGLVSLILADVSLAYFHSIVGALVGTALWGLHLGLTQGLFAAIVADASAPRLRATAFGIYNFATGVTLLFASILAGALWTAYGAPMTFLVGALFAFVALLAMLFVIPAKPPSTAGG
jgi:MFS family permease